MNNNQKLPPEKTTILLLFSSIFIFLFIFFSVYHPITITTPDDWYFMSATRDAIPLMSEHNPTRVLPEIAAPFAAFFSLAIFQTIGVDYVMAIAYGTALIMACLIVCYLYNFHCLIRQRFNLGLASQCCVVLFFFLFHFLAFRHKIENNPYLFGSFSLTTYYYYTMPMLMIMSLVLYCLRTNILDCIGSQNYWKQGLFYLLLYLSLASNLYSSIILVSYLIVRLFFILFRGHSFTKSIADNKISVFCLLFYTIILFMEASGDNADQLTANDEGILLELRHSLGLFSTIPRMLNLWFVLFSFVIIIAALICFRKSASDIIAKRQLIREISFGGLNFFIISLFIILVSAKAIPDYTRRPESLFAESFWCLLGISFCLAYCLKKMPKIKAVLPFIFLLLLCNTNTRRNTFDNVYGYGTMVEDSQKIVNFVKQADINNLDSLNIYVPFCPKTIDVYNWPYCIHWGYEVSESLNKFSQTRKRINLHFIAVKGLDGVTTSLSPCQKDSIVPHSFWFKE